MIDFNTLPKLPKNVGDLGKLIVAKGFEKLPKVQKIAQSGHTVAPVDCFHRALFKFLFSMQQMRSFDCTSHISTPTFNAKTNKYKNELD